MIRVSPFVVGLALAACQPSGAPTADEAENAAPAATPLRPATPAPEPATGEWREMASGIAYAAGKGSPDALVLSCRDGRLSATLPATPTIGSEERLSVGGGGEIETLVVDVSKGAPAVTGAAAAPSPDRLRAILRAGVGANYGATALGPLVPVPEELADRFVAGCAR